MGERRLSHRAAKPCQNIGKIRVTAAGDAIGGGFSGVGSQGEVSAPARQQTAGQPHPEVARFGIGERENFALHAEGFGTETPGFAITSGFSGPQPLNRQRKAGKSVEASLAKNRAAANWRVQIAAVTGSSESRLAR